MNDNNKVGRPPLSRSEETVTLTITVTASHAEFLKECGFGNVSLGVRRLADEKIDEIGHGTMTFEEYFDCWLKGRFEGDQ